MFISPVAYGAGSFTETELGEVRFPEISTPILERVCQYCYYKLRWANA
jgi:elongin-C